MQPPPGATTDEDRLVDALVQTSFVTMAVLTKVAADHDLSLTSMRVLAILADRRVRMSELADHLGLEKSTMTGLVDRATKRGLLARGPNADDGRAVDVFLTPAGAELVDRVHARAAEALSPHTDVLTTADRRRLQALLEQVLGRPA